MVCPKKRQAMRCKIRIGVGLAGTGRNGGRTAVGRVAGLSVRVSGGLKGFELSSLSSGVSRVDMQYLASKADGFIAAVFLFPAMESAGSVLHKDVDEQQQHSMD